MPLLEAWEPYPHCLAAIWRVGEPESFFTERTGLQTDIRHEKRRMERLAGRFLLQHLKADFPVHHIFPDAQDKPRIPQDQYFFSISHSFPYVAAIVSDKAECGIDIQVWHRRMEVLQHKFLSPAEQLFFKNDLQQITMAWCAKEAAYKWLGQRGIDFIEQLPIVGFRSIAGQFDFMINVKSANSQMPLPVRAFFTQDFAMAITSL